VLRGPRLLLLAREGVLTTLSRRRAHQQPRLFTFSEPCSSSTPNIVPLPSRSSWLAVLNALLTSCPAICPAKPDGDSGGDACCCVVTSKLAYLLSVLPARFTLLPKLSPAKGLKLLYVL
jgi:hypothetical protein